MKIAFIGLGIMGSRMASNLLKNNVDLTVYNRTVAKSEELAKEGAKLAKTSVDAVKEADIVFSMLSKPEVVSEVFFGENKVLANMKKNAIWVDCSTVNPSFSLEANTWSKKYDIRFVDAPQVQNLMLKMQN